MRIKNKKTISLGIGIIVVLSIVGTVGALNGWFGGGAAIPSDTMTRGLMGYWSMDEASGPLVYDKSGQGNDGMINDGGSGNPVSYWTFDEQTGSTAYDYISSNIGTLINSPTWVSSGKIGGALQFDGVDDYVNIGSTNFPSGASDRTVSAWVKVPTTANLSGYPTIFSYGTADTGKRFRLAIYNTGKPYIEIYGSGLVASTTINDDTWHHIVAIQSSGAQYIYIDGVLSSPVGSLTLNTVLSSASIGMLGSSYYMSGLIDDVRIYNYVRGADQIKRDYLETYKQKFSAGKVSGALQLDGVDDYVDIGVTSGITSIYSIEAWIKINGSSSAGLSQAIFGGKTLEYAPIVDIDTANRPRIVADAADQYLISANALNNNTWYHYVAIFNGKYKGIYINGKLDTSEIDPTYTATWDGAGHLIGARSATPYRFFNGLIDEVRIYNRELSVEEIRYHYNRGGPVAEWSFNEGSGSVVYDATESNNDGVIYGGMATSTSDGSGWKTGKYSSALAFDGVNDYVSIPDSNSWYFGTNPFSIELWANFNSISGDKSIIGSDEGPSTVNKWAVIWDYPTSNKLGFSFNQPIIGEKTVTWAWIPSINTWYHIVISKSGSSWNLYINGVQTGGTQTEATSIANPAAPLTIGTEGENYAYFNGLIDDVRIYNYVRTPDEIALDYNSGFTARFGPQSSCDDNPGACITNGLMGYWSIDETTGPLVYDKSGNGNDGMINDGGSGNPVSYWTFDEQTGSTAYDYMGSNNGTLTNSPTWTSSGKVGGALQFDGKNDWVSPTGALSTYISATVGTIEAWIKPMGAGVSRLYAYQLPSVVNTSEGYLWISQGINTAEQNLDRIWVGNYGTANQVGVTYTIGEWMHIVWVHTGGVLYAYKNGVLVDSIASGNTGGTTNTIYIGKCNESNRFWDGLIDDVRIYNYARGADQIKRDYSETYKTKFTSGKVGGALQFDGKDDYVDAGSSANLDITSAITVEAWVKPNTNTGQIVSKRNSTVGSSYQFLILSSGKARFSFWVSSSEKIVDSLSTISLNTWSHLVGTYNGSVITFYINGVLDNTTVTSGSIDSYPTVSTRIGAVGSGFSTYYFNGLIDEVRIYNRALSETEIRYHYNRGGPVAEWKFDEGSGSTVYDSTNNNNDGTLYGAMATSTADGSGWKTGKYGSALAFDGTNDYVNAGGNVPNNITNQLTAEAWVYRISIPQSTFIAGQVSPTLVDYDWGLYHSTNFIFYLTNSVGTAASMTGTTVINNGQWYHLVGTYDGAYLRLYVNGIAEGTPAIQTGNVRDSGYNFLMGDWFNRYFNGLIDDVRIYNYARTPDQIKQDYNAGLAVSFGPSAVQCDDDPGACMTQGLIGYWGLEEGSGATTYDGSGNSNNGTLTNSPKWTSGIKPLSGGVSGGGALSFDGVNDYVDIGVTSGITSVYSIEAWIKIGGSTGLSQRILAGKTIEGSPVMDIDSTYHPRFVTDNSDIFLTSSNALNVGGWYHFVVIANGKYKAIYINGVLDIGETDPTYTATWDTSGHLIGAGLATPWRFFKGSIDEVRIYNRALSAVEVSYHYNRGGPMAYWKFNEGQGSTAYDETPNNNDGTLYGAMATSTADGSGWKTGKYSSALSFDGVNDYVSVADSATFRFGVASTARTIEFWIKSLNTTDTNNQRVFHQKATGNYSALIIAYKPSTNNISFGIYDGGDGNPDYEFGKVKNLSDGWHHIVFNYTLPAAGQAMSTITSNLYIDGVAQAYSPSSAGNFDASLAGVNSFYIGRDDNVSNPYFQGLIDDVRIYNYVRTPQQILQDYNAGFSTYFK